MPETLAQRVRAKFPGAYDDLSDAELEAKVDAKYPGAYDDLPRSKPAKPPARALPFKEGMRPVSEEEYQEAQAAMETPLNRGLAVASNVGATLLAGGGLAGPVGRAVISPVGQGALKAGSVLMGGGGPIAAATAAGKEILWGKVLGAIAKGSGKAAAAPKAAQAESTAARTLTAETKVVDGIEYAKSTNGGWFKTGKTFEPPPAAVPAAAPVAPRAAPKPAEAPTELEDQLRQSIEALKNKAAAPPKPAAVLTPAQETMKQAQALEARIVDFKTRQGLSQAQIVNILKEQGIRERGMAKAMVEMVLKHHGLN